MAPNCYSYFSFIVDKDIYINSFYEIIKVKIQAPLLFYIHYDCVDVKVLYNSLSTVNTMKYLLENVHM